MIEINQALVTTLVSAQFPQWAELPIRRVQNDGWDNRTFRLGADMSVRLPSGEAYSAQVEKEHRWLPVLAPHLPLDIPVPLALGVPGHGYPWNWSVYRWLEGETAIASRWTGSPVWVHGDVAATNLLIRDGRLSAVIDFGCSCVGDPACDVTIAWTLLSGVSRELFRSTLMADAGTWARGRGWALWKGLITLVEHLDTNPAEAAEAGRVVNEVLTDHES